MSDVLAFAAGSVALAALSLLRSRAPRLENWSRNQIFAPSSVHSPSTIEEVQAIVKGASSVKTLGSAHSFNDSCATDGALILLGSLAASMPPTLDAAGKTVTCCAGMRYGDLLLWLAKANGGAYTLHNTASLPHISIGGAIATGTHGSGVRNGNLATAVVGLDFVLADGSRRALRAGRDADFDGAVVHLGALGVLVAVTLALVPAFEVNQRCFEDLPFEALVGSAGGGGASALGSAGAFGAVMGAGYSVSLFTTWGKEALFEQVWVKRVRGGDDDDAATAAAASAESLLGAIGARAATADLHPIPGISAAPCTPQMGAWGPAHDRLPHFRLDFTPSVGDELQSEFFVGAADAPAALRALRADEALRASIAAVLHISEIRSIRGDGLWMSPHGGRVGGSIAIHFTWKKEIPTVMALLPRIEAALAPFAVRPHWGKLFTVPPAALATRYERMADFDALRAKMDPTGKFLNDYLRKTVGLGSVHRPAA